MKRPRGKAVIVCGGRSYSNKEVVYRVLDSLSPVAVIRQGGASGADSLAATWALDRGVEQKEYSADWAAHGRKAGPIRNQAMINAGADLVVAFPGGRGTADTVRRARTAGIAVLEIAP